MRIFACLLAATCLFYTTGLPSAQAEKPTDTSPTPSKLVIKDIRRGTGRTPQKGGKVVVHYTGWLANGKKFDSSKDRKMPFVFVFGEGHVIQGWDEGLKGMQEGGTRKLTIPPEMAYGAEGAGGVIPPNATLIFDVDLLKVEPAP